jgi:hypothetical protein
LLRGVPRLRAGFDWLSLDALLAAAIRLCSGQAFARDDISLVGAGGCHQGGSFVFGEGAGCAPEDVSLAVDEQGDDLFDVGDVEILEEFRAVDVEGHDPVPGDGIGLVAAHRGGFPPAEDEVLVYGDRQMVVAKLEISVLEGLGDGQPGLHVLLLFGREGEDEQVGLAFYAAGQNDFLLVEAVRSDGGEGDLFLGVGHGEEQRGEAEDRERNGSEERGGPVQQMSWVQ